MAILVHGGGLPDFIFRQVTALRRRGVETARLRGTEALTRVISARYLRPIADRRSISFTPNERTRLSILSRSPPATGVLQGAASIGMAVTL